LDLRNLGGAGRDRTDDLIVANSQPCSRPNDTEEVRVAQSGSVHAGLLTVPCSAPVPERHDAKAPDTGMDRRVTTQVTTQKLCRAFRLSRTGIVWGMPGAGAIRERAWSRSEKVQKNDATFRRTVPCATHSSRERPGDSRRLQFASTFPPGPSCPIPRQSACC
jgi:hypothetical protein